MQILSLVWGILAAIGLVIGFFPWQGSLNWIDIPFAAIGLAIGFVAHNRAKPEDKRIAAAGALLCALSSLVGLLRLIVGWGIV